MGPLASDDDPRVREWTKENSAEMKRYFDLLSEILMLEQIIKVLIFFFVFLLFSIDLGLRSRPQMEPILQPKF